MEGYFERDYYDEEPYFAPNTVSNGQKRTDDKFRRLPCRTFICTGTCPYRERCVYLHDPRIISRNVKSKSRRKNKDDVVSDAWFWPVMSDDDLVLDHSNQPIVNQFYHVPLPRFEQANSHNVSVYSMWMHFVEYCIELSTKPSERATFSMIHSQHQVFCHPDELAELKSGRKKHSNYVNMYTGEKRLKVFIQLSNGQGVSSKRTEETCFSPNSVAVPIVSVSGSTNGTLLSRADEGKVSSVSPARYYPSGETEVEVSAKDMLKETSFLEYNRIHLGDRPVAEVVYSNSPRRSEAPHAVLKRTLEGVVPPVNTWTKTGAPSGMTLPFSMSMW